MPRRAASDTRCLPPLTPSRAGSRSPIAKATAMPSTHAAAIRKAGCMPSIRPSIRNTMAPTHIWNVTDPVASER